MWTKNIKNWFKSNKKDQKDFKENSKLKSKLDSVKPKKIVLLGNPNVGKSMLFNQLTGSYVTVSNYPGTTVTVDRGKFNIDGKKFEIMDSPGMYSLSSITEEERISKLMLLEEDNDIIIHVVDSKNLERMLTLTLQLIEAELPIILVLNMMDEAKKVGTIINHSKLEKQLGIPVVPTTAATGHGLDLLREMIGNYHKKDKIFSVEYNTVLEAAVNKISALIHNKYPISKRALSLLLLQEDGDVKKLIKENNDSNYEKIMLVVKETTSQFRMPLNYLFKLRLQKNATELVSSTLKTEKTDKLSWGEKISRLMINPVTGIPILLVIMYFGLYQFVGVFGAGDLVDLVESTIFGEWINPFVTNFVLNYIPFTAIQELLVGEYGIWTLGVTYATAIILPIVGTFFLMFSIMEDSGYLPRLAMLINRFFNLIGLSGRAVIPMVLGLGCGSMATMVTRTLETPRERTIATILLALTIPCAAQLGVIFAVLSGHPSALWLWFAIMLLLYVIIGLTASKLLPGENPTFYMEIPPLRLPRPTQVLKKTYTRLIWYFKEIIPLFILISIILWALSLTGILNMMIALIAPVITAIGLPIETAETFILGFFRRDYGAAGLYDIQSTLTGVQLLVSAVVLTLFMPCVAQFMVMTKERGWKISLLIAVFVVTFAFTMGFVLNWILTTLGVVL
ncbi:MAG: ferrous iron transport protein B [Methanobacteriaceae archaeon]|nr:ferrous iron transport protein B [Methanobacteriaceae archaeon]MDO9627025.1 ferrous iron transport protein B [Methanobacteriaceae archaeon]